MGFLGCHVSISGGVQNAPLRAKELGCETMQIFTRNQRQWAAKPLVPEQIAAFREGVRQHRLQGVMVHSSYLINLASPDPIIRAKSETAFLDELDRCEQLGIPYYVFHPGSHKKTSEAQGIRRLVDSLHRLFAARPDYQVIVLVENTAGGGSKLGGTFEQLGTILDQCSTPERLAVCFDTAHAFQAGYALRTAQDYADTLDQFHHHVGVHHLRAFHLNDSRSRQGSHNDRHENIGQGYIGLELFRHLVNDPRFHQHPMALETPGGEEAFRRNLQLLFSLRRG